MDFLREADEAIQREVFFAVANLFNLEVDVLLFDTTSTYFETEDDDDFPRYGHSKGHRPDRPTASGGDWDQVGRDYADVTFPTPAEVQSGGGVRQGLAGREAVQVIAKAILLLATTLVIAGCSAAPTSPNPHPSPAPSLSPSATVSTLPPTCAAAAMSEALGRTGAASSHDSFTFILTNAGNGPGHLNGYPLVQLVDATGNLPTTQLNGFNPYLNPSSPQVTAAGTQECDQTTEIAIQLPGGERLDQGWEVWRDLLLTAQMAQHPLAHLAALGVAVSLDQIEVDSLTADDPAQVHRLGPCHNPEKLATQLSQQYRVLQHFSPPKLVLAGPHTAVSNSDPSLASPTHPTFDLLACQSPAQAPMPPSTTSTAPWT